MITSSSSTGKFSGYLFCSDFDGTLTQDGKTVSRENLDAINYFVSEGGRFTMASGRFPDFFTVNENFGINAPVIALGGSVIADVSDGVRIVSERNVDPGIIRRLAECFDSIPGAQSLIIHSNSESVTFAPGDPDNSEKLELVLSRPVCKFIIVENPKIEPALREFMEREFPKLTLEMSWCSGLEGLAPGVCKGSAVKILRDLIGDINTVVAVGDYENDISMIKYADFGYATANAADFVKAVADRITVTNREHAIAAIINELDGGI